MHLNLNMICKTLFPITRGVKGIVARNIKCGFQGANALSTLVTDLENKYISKISN